MLKLSNVSIAYNEKVVLDQLDLTAPPNHLYISKHLLCIPMDRVEHCRTNEMDRAAASL